MEYIGFVKAPIDPEQVDHIKTIMKAHGASPGKIRSEDSDHWWTVFLPDGTTREETGLQVEVPRYKICFPDGYWFLYEAGILDRRGQFTRDPVISLDPSS